MSTDSKSIHDASRAESLLPNACEYLRLLEVQIVGIDKAATVNSVDILGWAVRDGCSIPITVFGVLEPKDGWHYAILDTRNQSHVDLSDGTQHVDYKAFMAPKWRAFEQGQKAAAPEVTEPTVEAREASGPQAWKAVRK